MDVSHSELYAEVILPLPIKTTFTYRIPQEYRNATVGCRALVPFGVKKFYSGVIVNVFESSSNAFSYELKEIISILEYKPILLDKQLKLISWISDYYMEFLGVVLNNALPALFKITSETFITIHPDFSGEISNLSPQEYELVNSIINNNKLSIKQATDILNVKQATVYKYVYHLLDECVLELQEEIKNPYKPAVKEYFVINKNFQDEKKINEVFKSLEKRSYHQLRILLSYFKNAENYEEEYPEIQKKIIIDDTHSSPSTLKTLQKKGVIDIIQRKVSRLDMFEASKCPSNIILNDFQLIALDKINTLFNTKNVVLLHGVTSSGKTEIYFKIIEQILKNGKQVLFMLPEIALTTQIVERTAMYFGKQVGVYHSKFNHNERVEIWNSVLDNNDDFSKGYNLIIGTRSSLFLPFNKLGLIVIDEEHDYSYKQSDIAPRYNARDSAIFLAKQFNTKVLLGSATPSIESYNNAVTGKYALVELSNRYGGMPLPETIIIDMKKNTTKNSSSNFSKVFIDEMKATLNRKQQIIIYHNRRGFSLRLECEACGWVPECPHCDVSLVYHKTFNQMKCHYCGYTSHVPQFCPECGSSNIFMKGYGTELIEEELYNIFPQAIIKRMDLDTTKRKNSFANIISEFASGKIDILVGTQMVTKGLDFNNVSLVGIVNVDNLLYFPDFRSFERSFQQVCQVSGRAGRKNEEGKVLIQTYSPTHEVLKYAVNNDYKQMFYSQISDRKAHLYPPYYRLIDIKLKHKDSKILDKAAGYFVNLLKQYFDTNVLGPEYHYIPRINNQYIKSVLVKIEKNSNYQQQKSNFAKAYDTFLSNIEYKSVRTIIDVDPY